VFPRQLRTYLCAPLAVAGVWLLYVLFWPWLSETPFLLFICAVAATAVYGGWKPAILAVFLSLAVTVLFLLPPHHSMSLSLSPPVWGGAGAFLAASATVVWLAAAHRRSEARFRAAQDLSPDGFVLLRPLRDRLGAIQDFCFEYANPAAVRMAKRSALSGRRLLELFPGMKRDLKAFTCGARVMETGRPDKCEVFYDADEIRGWFRILSTRAGDNLAVSFSDTTRRKQDQEALRESEERFRQLADSMPQLVWTARPDGTVDYYNRRYLEFGGIEPGADGAWHWAPVLHPDDLDATVEAWRHAVQTGETYEIAHRVLRADGEYRWHLSRALASRNAEGRIVRWCGTATDIHEQKLAQEALRESEARLALAQQAASVGFFDWDILADTSVWTEQTHVIYGVALGEASFRMWAEHVHPDDLPRVLRGLEKLYRKQRREMDADYRIVRPDGEVRWITNRGIVLYNESGQPVRMVGACVDITERKRAEEAVQRSEAVLAQAGHMAHIGAWEAELTPDGEVCDLHWSEETYRIFGYEPGRFEASDALFQERVHPEDRARIREAVGQACAERRPYSLEHRILREDGTERIVLEHAEIAFDDAGRPLRMVGAVQDITERKRAEEALRQSELRFREAFAHAPIGMVLMALDGRFLHVNRAYCELVGIDEEELLNSKLTFRDLTHPDDLGQNLDAYAQLVEGRVPAFFVEKRYLRRDGETVWVRASATLRRDAHGNPMQVVGLVEDITGRKKMEVQLRSLNHWLEERIAERTKELLRSQEALRQSERLSAIGQVATTLSHESRNAIQSTLAALEIVGRRLKDQGPLLDVLDKAKRAQQDILRLYDEVREYAAPAVLQFDRVALSEVWREAWDDVLPQRLGRDATLVELTNGTDCGCVVDAFHMRRVFRNLMENSLAACADPVEIRIACEHMSLDERPGLRVVVRDNGPGVTEEHAARVFEPFYTTKSKGTGLGMAISRRVVEEHGGRVVLGEASGPGFEVVIDLPKDARPTL